jgi:endo-1,4-beta-mannosidase
MADFTLGVNYWPRARAMHWWKAFDRIDVETEFAQIADLGLQVARIFLFWEDFQPTPDRVNDAALADLGTVLDVAQTAGIHVMPSFFTGHMSGINWWPLWALTDIEEEQPNLRMAGGEYTLRVGRDPYTDPLMLAAETLLIREVCGRYGLHPAIYSWNLSNEPDLFFMPKTWEDGSRWNATLVREIRRLSPYPVSAGMHMPTLNSYNGFRPDGLAPHDDWLSMHGYSIYYGTTATADPLNSDVVPIACLVTEALGGKPVLFEEFGYASSERGDASYTQTLQRPRGDSPQHFASDEAGGVYYREVLNKLARCGAIGALGWMYSDYVPALWETPPFDRAPHERWFGLTRADGSIKPAGEAMRDFARRIREEGVPPRTVGPLQLNPDEWYTDPKGNFDRTFEELRGRI